ncbi:hypothetical protein JAAARDRAFT_704064 [Jaapia argillacea MUCL 33604]|uniref:DUF4470 domain-containing protein n=1 Tax=Jaapia argillacea MUCL 33604 TaxID=933084 RepID=A0A067PMS0_9AGAM|nr:hypothetical protein JAAARDRAFT_704064 [Jaapia argillacea MUCL 33604]
MYSKAEELAPSDPIYPSNLSAALFEVGDYVGCSDAIFRCWNKMTDRSNQSLLLRLSLRLAKSLCHGVCDGSITYPVTDDKDHVITALRAIALAQVPPLQEQICAWNDWTTTQDDRIDPMAGAKKARMRLADFPKFKSQAYVDLLYDLSPFFAYQPSTSGQDHIMSIIDDWGRDHPNPLKLEGLDHRTLSNIAFLFGGVGDARHVFGSLIGLHKAFDRLSKAKRESFQAHITLLDIHPTALARDLCLLMLLHEMTDETKDAVALSEISATIFYVIKTMDDLCSRLSATPTLLPHWLHVDSRCVSPVLKVFQYWNTLEGKKNCVEMLRHHPFNDLVDSSMTGTNSPADIIAAKDAKRQEYDRYFDAMTEAKLRELFKIPPTVAPSVARIAIAKIREDMVEKAVEQAMGGSSSKEDELWFDKIWYSATKTFLPPPELWSRHPGLDGFRQKRKESRDHVNQSWVPNVTLFYHDPTGYPDVNLDPFELIEGMRVFNNRFQLAPTLRRSQEDGYPFYHSTAFFDSVTQALKGLSGRIQLEVLLGDLDRETEMMQLQADSTRPPEFPRSFSRIWLSNVPDYIHGPLTVAQHCVPVLQSNPKLKATAASNCMLNSGVWESGDDFIYTYTLLLPAEVPRYLGCDVVEKEIQFGLTQLAKRDFPRPLSELASRAELKTWLTRTLLHTIVPGTSLRRPCKILLPNNLVAFLKLLVHLRAVGFPGHWLSDFLQTVLSDTLVTDLSPYRGKFPIPSSDRHRRVNSRRVVLNPWLPDFESVLAITRKALPFAVSSPTSLPKSPDDIGQYRATVAFVPLLMQSDGSPYDSVHCLLFVKSGLDPADMISEIPLILEGQRPQHSESVYILTAPEFIDVPNRMVRWRMSRERMAGMRRESWSMVVYRADVVHPGMFFLP